MCNIVTAPEATPHTYPLVFLAGGANTFWRDEFVLYFDQYNITFLNPIRKNWDSSNKEWLKDQILWEKRNLERADIVVFWFTKNSLNPISLFELGKMLNRKSIIVGIDQKYEKKYELINQINHPVYFNLRTMANALQGELGEFEI